MKLKILLLSFLSIICIIIIYNSSYEKIIKVTSINSLDKSLNYNNSLSSYLSSSNIKIQFNIDFTDENMEIENLIARINNNDYKIQSVIHNSNTLVLSLGNIDLKSEKKGLITNELIELFKLIRSIYNKEIIFISFNNITSIKDICRKYNIKYINGNSYKNNIDLLAKQIYLDIYNTWK